MRRRTFLTVLSAGTVGACARVEKGPIRDFPQPGPSELALGSATLADIERTLGPPRLRYSFPHSPRSPYYPPGVRGSRIPEAFRHVDAEEANLEVMFYGVLEPFVRSGYFCFWHSKLVLYKLYSDSPHDPPRFDSRHVAAITPDQTTRAEVERLLGPPPSEGVYPMIRSPDLRAISYYRERPAKYGWSSELAVFLCDNKGIVREKFSDVRAHSNPPGPIGVTVRIG